MQEKGKGKNETKKIRGNHQAREENENKKRKISIDKDGKIKKGRK